MQINRSVGIAVKSICVAFWVIVSLLVAGALSGVSNWFFLLSAVVLYWGIKGYLPNTKVRSEIFTSPRPYYLKRLKWMGVILGILAAIITPISVYETIHENKLEGEGYPQTKVLLEYGKQALLNAVYDSGTATNIEVDEPTITSGENSEKMLAYRVVLDWKDEQQKAESTQLQLITEFDNHSLSNINVLATTKPLKDNSGANCLAALQTQQKREKVERARIYEDIKIPFSLQLGLSDEDVANSLKIKLPFTKLFNKQYNAVYFSGTDAEDNIEVSFSPLNNLGYLDITVFLGTNADKNGETINTVVSFINSMISSEAASWIQNDIAQFTQQTTTIEQKAKKVVAPLKNPYKWKYHQFLYDISERLLYTDKPKTHPVCMELNIIPKSIDAPKENQQQKPSSPEPFQLPPLR